MSTAVVSQPSTLDLEAPSPEWRDLAIALVGPAAVGACVGWPSGGTPLLVMSGLVPLSFLIVGALTLPGLYVGSALMGAAPPARVMSRVAIGAFKDQGLVFLGLTPAMLFLCATSTDVYEALVVGTIGVFLGAMVGVRVFFLRLSRVTEDAHLAWAFALWAIVSAFLGWEVYLEMLNLGGLS